MERQHYLWTAGGGTVSVSLAADVVRRLRNAATNREPSEIGGILLGRRESDDHISISDFEIVSSEHRRGVTFTLSGADKRRLAQRLSSKHRGLQPVGSFRTHLRQGLYMDQYDFDLMQEYFSASTDVMLLVRPTDWQAGFFVWEEGDISRQKSYTEFHFDPAALPLSAPLPSEPQPTIGKSIRRKSVASTSGRLPILMKVGIVAATAGLAGVLAFYSHEHRAQDMSHVSPVLLAANSIPHVAALNPPLDPDTPSPVTSPDLQGAGNQYELHVKVPPRPSPFAVDVRNDVANERPVPQPSTPPVPSQPVQTASITPPPSIAQTVLRPVRPTFVSEVSLEPSQPGVLRRGIHHVPVLKLFDRHDYKSGSNFAPARPVREVRPRLPEDVQQEGPQHPDVAVRIWINDAGQVTKAETLTDHVDPEIADLASNAAYKWAFEPARISDRPVSSEMIMHFRFVPKQSY